MVGVASTIEIFFGTGEPCAQFGLCKQFDGPNCSFDFFDRFDEQDFKTCDIFLKPIFREMNCQGVNILLLIETLFELV
eukprot:snap_masked-scaffold_52-processed-gene-0.26-mRNA-1 protein AED:1.00 eAED:1.00 QI:0/0/0/0/1/1/4/0/77